MKLSNWKYRRFCSVVAATVAAIITAAKAESCHDLFLSFHLEKHGLPASAIVIALGLDSQTESLQRFANRLEKKLQRRVVTYQQFADARYTSESGKWWETLPPERVTAIVEGAIRQAVAKYTQNKIIAFNLDGYDPKELFGPDGKRVWSYTNFEVDLILRDRQLYAATRWYRDLRELTSDEAETFWALSLQRMAQAPPW